MKKRIRTPYFEIGVKNYVYGDDVLKMALHADACAEKYDVDIVMIVPYLEIRRVCERTRHLFVFAPYMDTLRPGRGMADILPEAIKAAGACGVATMSILPGCAAQEIGSSADVPSRRILILIGASPEGNTVKLADSFAQGAASQRSRSHFDFSWQPGYPLLSGV